MACRTTPQPCQEPVHWQHEQLLIYRVIELTLKAIYLLQRLFCGPLSQVWGNWLDIVVLIVGISNFAVSTESLAHLWVLRRAQLARVLKFAHMMLIKGISCAQGRGFPVPYALSHWLQQPLECDVPDSHY